MNGKKIQAGKFRNRNQFWIDGDSFGCDDDGWTASPKVIIQNEAIIKDTCTRK